MFGSNVIDILIGLIVIFLSVGLAVSAGTELVSQWLRLRPQQLKKALAGMLDGSLATGTTIPEKHWFFLRRRPRRTQPRPRTHPPARTVNKPGNGSPRSRRSTSRCNRPVCR